MECNFCFICLAPVTPSKVHGERGRRKPKRIRRTNTNLNSARFLIKYLSSYCDGDVLKDVYKLLNGMENDGEEGKVLRLCTNCDLVADKILELQLELEKIQMRIVEEVKSVRGRVLSSSGWLGGCGREEEEESGKDDVFANFSDRFLGGDGSPRGRAIFDALKAFQMAVHRNDQKSIHVPLVYLEKFGRIWNRRSDFVEESGLRLELKREPCSPSPYNEAPVNEDFIDDGFLNLDLDPDPGFAINSQLENVHLEELGAGGTEVKTEDASKVCKDEVEVEVESCIKLEPQIEEKQSRLRPRLASKRQLQLQSTKKTLRGKGNRSGLPPKKKKTASPKKTPKPKTDSKKKRKRIRLVRFCDTCPFQTIRVAQFETHLREHETGENEKIFQCDRDGCSLAFSNEQHFHFHQDQHSGRQRLLCDICYWPFPTLELSAHLKTHVEEVFPCRYCSHFSSSRDKYVEHFVKNHVGNGRVVECDRCEERFPTEKFLRKHLHQAHQAIQPLQCDWEGCTKTYLKQLQLDIHKRLHTGEFSCEECGKRFISKFSLQNHQMLHRGETRYRCDQCPEALQNKQKMKEHMRQKHGATKLKCKSCSKEYTTNSGLRGHMRKEHGEGGGNICPICGTSFANSSRLKSHIEGHSDENKYVCEECGKGYKTSMAYSKHKRLHRERNFKCPHCPEAFVLGTYLTQHIRRHTGEKPYKCKVCGRGFTQTGARTIHQKKCQQKPALAPAPAPAPE